MRRTACYPIVFCILICLFCNKASAQYTYDDTNSVKACFKGYCQTDTLRLSELAKLKTLKLVLDDDNFKVIEFYINVTSLNDEIFIERVRYDHLNRNYLNLLAKGYKSLKLTEILVRDKNEKLLRLKPVFYWIVQ